MITRNVKLVTAKIQILDAIRWDGSGVCMESIAAFLGDEYSVAMNTMVELEITTPESLVKYVEVGNFVAKTDMGTMVLLTNRKVQKDFRII